MPSSSFSVLKRSRKPAALLVGSLALVTLNQSSAMAEGVHGEFHPGGFSVGFAWLLALGGALSALYFAWKFFTWMIEQPEGGSKMVYIAEKVREGANAYLNAQYKLVAVFFGLTAVFLAFVAFGLEQQSHWVPFAFMTGGFFSGLAGWFGMKTATMASSRTAQGCKSSLNAGLQVAFRSGAVMGLVVVGLGLLDICLWFATLHWFIGMPLHEITVTMLCFGMGASAQALFARVGGGIFTKAADVGADLVGKVEAGIPEDDPRNPATIADNVGDNVGDVAGMGADLYESYCGSILASAALGVAAYRGFPDMQFMLFMLPLVLASAGIGLSIFGIHLVKTEDGASQRDLLKALAKGIDGSSLLVAGAALVIVFFMLVLPSRGIGLETAGLPSGWALFGIFGSIVTGLVAGVVIGRWTEYSTSEEYPPTRRIADQSATGPATVIIAGIAEGFYSVWVPIVTICTAIILAFGFANGFAFRDPQLFSMGLYGVAIAAVGMLSTLGITLATDAYGPIADNAGGNAEMSGLDPSVRERTDALDSLGNTTAATGKGFAIGSAALTALALLAAYLEEVRVGFDRWVEGQAVAAVTERLDEANLFKVTENLFATKTGTEGAYQYDAYLMFPPIGSEPDESIKKLSDAEVGKQVSGVFDMQKMTGRGQFVNNEVATIPDYVRYYDISPLNPKVLVGMFSGVMLAFVFCAMTMKAVGRAAGAMVEEVRRQFRELKGIMEGDAEPEYSKCVAISTKAAQHEMLLPACMGLGVPLVIGLLLGVAGVVGMLAGGLTSGFALAIMMSNSGGAWDNAKKMIEEGFEVDGQPLTKGSEAHKAAVVGDTVGDPFKDTSGPSLNILLKLMSVVALVIASLI